MVVVVLMLVKICQNMSSNHKKKFAIWENIRSSNCLQRSIVAKSII